MLSDKDKTGLQSAIDKIADYCGEGLSPNDAIVKAAQDLRLTKDMLPILVNAFNVGATAEHWAAGNSVKEKTASFPIADIHEIRSRLYPEKVKSASAARYTDQDPLRSMSARQLFGEDALSCYRPALPAMQKSASAPTADQLHKSAQDVRAAAERAEKESSSAYNQAMLKLEAGLNKLASIVRSPSMPGFEVLKKTAETVYGPSGALVMDELKRMDPSVTREKLTKVSSALRTDSPFYQTLGDVVRQLPVCQAAGSRKAAVLSKCAHVRKQLDKQWMTSVYGSAMQRSIRRAGMNKSAWIWEIPGDSPKTMSRLEDMLLPEAAGSTLNEFGILEALADSAHTAELDGIRAKSILTDLINTDSALRTYPPEEVVEAYNELMEIAPHLAGKKMAIRQALREYMATESLDLNSLGQIAKLEADTSADIAQRKREEAERAARYAQEQQRQRDTQADRAFRASEADKERKARASEAEKERKARTSEADKERKFRADESKAQRGNQTAIADANRELQKRIAAGTLMSQARNRAAQSRIADANRASQENIARDNRTSQSRIAQADRDAQNMRWTVDTIGKHYLARSEQAFRSRMADADRAFRTQMAEDDLGRKQRFETWKRDTFGKPGNTGPTGTLSPT